MSHFTVLVIGENAEEQLAPFQENNMGDCPKEFMEFTDEEDEYKEEYESGSTERVQLEDGRLVASWDDMFRVDGSFGIGSNSHKVPDHLKRVDVPFKELYQTFDKFVNDWHGRSERDPEKNRYGYWENPNRKWDWYQLGGRWTGFFKVREGALSMNGNPSLVSRRRAEPGYGDTLLKEDIDFEYMRNKAGLEAQETYEKAWKIIEGTPIHEGWDSVRDRIKDHEKARTYYWNQARCKRWQEAENKHDDFGLFASPDDFLISKVDYIENARNAAGVTHAVIKDGKWYESGEMGWWGVVHNEKDANEWNREFSALIDTLPGDTRLSVYDCHI